MGVALMTAEFFQDPPQLGNQYTEDGLLRSYLRRLLPAEVQRETEPELARFGQRVVDEIPLLATDAETHPPRLVSFDPWGRRIDRIEVAAGWQALDRISAEEGLVAIGYERQFGAASRLVQFAKLYLFNPSSAVYTCPLAMADGAARLIEVHGDDWLLAGPYRHLISRDPAQFWTSGQWMTERTGGSDVGQSETIARAHGDHYQLFGTKWFTSATTSQMAMTLARIEDAQGATVAGSRGLSLFYLETRQSDGQLNRICIHRLKDKLGTKALPTAELSLEGTVARLVGGPGEGVRNIATLMNITRLYNSICAAAAMRRGLALLRDYATRRKVFGRLLSEQPLHAETLADLDVDLRASLALVLRAVELLGREECGSSSSEERAVLRLLTPLTKLYTAKRCVAAMSETLEGFGGAGYIEDTGLPKLLRDSQVLAIWEGTTNVLSLDALRAIERDEALSPFLADIGERLDRCDVEPLSSVVDEIRSAVRSLERYIPQAMAAGLDSLQAGARRFAMGLAEVYSASLLVEHAAWSLQVERDGTALAAVSRYVGRGLLDLGVADETALRSSQALAFGRSIPAVGRRPQSATP
jgi:alkylation response protein AidB-like acyl-CoA dehydrogenase